MICSNCGMIIGTEDMKCGYCLQQGTGRKGTPSATSTVPQQMSTERGETPDSTVSPSVETKEESGETSGNSNTDASEMSLAEQYGLLGQTRVLVTSRGARMGLFNTKIVSEITYSSDGLMIQRRPAKFQDVSQIAYKDIVDVKVKRTISAYWIIVMVMGVMLAAVSAGTGLILSVAAFFLGRDYNVCIQQRNGMTTNIVSASNTNTKLFYTELLKIKGM